MTIQSVRLVPYRLPLRDPWPTAEGPILDRHGCLLILEEKDGRLGVGDAAPLPGFGLETIASCVAALRTAARRLIGLSADAYLEGAAHLTHLAPVAAAPTARHAIDLALHDLAAQRAGVPIAQLLGGAEALDVVPANAVVPRVDAARAGALARDAVQAGARTIKVKVGGGPLHEDLARVRAVREEAGEPVAIRLDANQAWTEAEAIAALAALRVYGLEYVEQPVSASDVAGLARVRRSGGVPIAADEAASDARAVRRLLDAEAADILVLKPMALGGLHAARAAAALARERGVMVVVTSFVDSAVGRTGALHLAASLGAGPLAHGVATGTALLEDVAAGPSMHDGAVPVPRVPGLGILLDPRRLREAAVVEAA